jgi:hypothetical protein
VDGGVDAAGAAAGADEPDEAAGALLPLVLGALVPALSPLLLPPPVEEEAPSDLPLDFGVEEYRSAYQPPPLRMKLPALICRLAVLFAHFGQTSRAGSEIF